MSMTKIFLSLFNVPPLQNWHLLQVLQTARLKHDLHVVILKSGVNIPHPKHTCSDIFTKQDNIKFENSLTNCHQKILNLHKT